MAKRTNAFQRNFKKILEQIQLKYAGLSIAKQVTIIGGILGVVSLFFPWIIDSNQTVITWNAFTALAGNIGYVLIFLFLVQIFLTLSENYKEKIKLYSDIDFKNHFLIITTGAIALVLSAVCLSFSIGLSMINQYMQYGNGPILCIVAGILIVGGGIIIRLDDKKNNSEIILQKLSQNRGKKKEKENMELPF